MTWLMTVAAGAAIGYFLVQFIQKNQSNRENGEAEGPRARLHKSATNKQIAGVCGGLAEYFNVDVSIIRIVTLLLVLGWGSGLLAYIVCALVLPTE
jgi:phage shock protein PspC (stress-responsive transcriptional regulator)